MTTDQAFSLIMQEDLADRQTATALATILPRYVVRNHQGQAIEQTDRANRARAVAHELDGTIYDRHAHKGTSK